MAQGWILAPAKLSQTKTPDPFSVPLFCSSRVDRINRSSPHQLLYIWKAVPFQLPLEQLAAALAELSYGSQQPFYPLFLVELCRRIVAEIGERKVVNRFLIILASPK